MRIMNGDPPHPISYSASTGESSGKPTEPAHAFTISIGTISFSAILVAERAAGFPLLFL